MIDIILSLTKLRRTVYKDNRFGESRLEDFSQILLEPQCPHTKLRPTVGMGLGLKKGVLLGPARLPP